MARASRDGSVDAGRSASPQSRRAWIVYTLLLLVLIAGLSIRVSGARRIVYPTVDAATYTRTAVDLVETGELRFSTFPPGWPLLISTGLHFTGTDDPVRSLRAGQFYTVGLGTLLGILVFLMMRRHHGPWWGLGAAAFVLATPEQIIQSTICNSEALFDFTYLAGWLLYEHRRNLSSGVVLGLAYVTRPEALLGAAALGFHALVRRRRIPWRYGIGVALFLVPFVAFVWWKTGAFALSSKGFILERAVLAQTPGQIIGRYLDNAWVFARMLMGIVGPGVLLLALIGAVRRPGAWLYMLLGALPVPLFPFVVYERYWIPYTPFLLIAAGYGGLAVAGWVRRAWERRGRRPLPPAALRGLGIALALVVGLSAWSSWRDQYRWVGVNADFYPGMRDAGLWLRERAGRDTVVAAYKPYVSFWSGCRFRKLPEEQSVALILGWARQNEVDYLVVNELVSRTLAPGLRPLMGQIPPQFEDEVVLVQIFRVPGRPEHTTGLYRILPEPGAAGLGTPGG